MVRARVLRLFDAREAVNESQPVSVTKVFGNGGHGRKCAPSGDDRLASYWRSRDTDV